MPRSEYSQNHFRSSDEKDSFKSLTKNNHEAPNQSTEFAKSKRSVSKGK